jgi:hypothetical protein
MHICLIKQWRKDKTCPELSDRTGNLSSVCTPAIQPPPGQAGMHAARHARCKLWLVNTHSPPVTPVVCKSVCHDGGQKMEPAHSCQSISHTATTSIRAADLVLPQFRKSLQEQFLLNEIPTSQCQGAAAQRLQTAPATAQHTGPQH